MEKLTRYLWRGLLVLFVSVGLGFGTAQATSTPAFEECGDDPHEIGTCPPITDSECETECQKEGFTHGDCINYPGGDCCVCTI